MQTTREEQLRAIFRDGERELAFWEREADALHLKYPDHFVAVDPETEDIVTVGTNLDDILDKLEALSIKPTDVWVEFLPTTCPPLLL
ncbi:MAG: hypothetical protein HYX51_04595 [Chloroflexi bacterium]|nr:hypothetical protein [Chloroflexota bacterium]